MLSLRIAALTLLAVPLGQAEETPKHLGPVTGIAVVGSQIYSISQTGIFREAKRLAKPPFRVMAMAAGGPLLLLGGGQPAASGDVAVYDSDGDSLAKLRLGDDLVYSVAVSPDGKTAAAAMADGRVLTLAFPDLAPGSVTEVNRHEAIVRAVAFSPDGRWLASAGLDGLVLLTPRKPKAKPIVLADHSAGVESLAFAPDSSQLATGSHDSRVRLHSIGGRLLRTFQGVGESPDATGFGQAPRVLCLDWSEAGLIGGTSSGYVFRLPNGQGDWQPLHRKTAGPVYSLGQTPEQIIAGKTGQLLRLTKPSK
jgi:WD40 repeat protein